MRFAVVVILSGALLAGCSGPKAEARDPVPSSALVGLDAAFAAAAAWDTAAELVSIVGVEATEPGSEEGDEAALWTTLDPFPGDGAAPLWMWTFRSTNSHRNFVLEGDAVVRDFAASTDLVADLADAKAMRHVPGSSDELNFDTVAMAGLAGARDRHWADPPYLNGGVIWVLSARDLPEWTAFGHFGDGLETVYGFDGETGMLNFEFTGERIPIPAVKPTLTLSGCDNFGGVFPVPMADAQAALPAGFTPSASPNDPAGGATLYVISLDCDGSSVDDEDTGPTIVQYAELAVTPPAGVGLDGITDYTVPLAIGATSDAVGARLAAWMLGQAGASTASDHNDLRPGPLMSRMVAAGVTTDLRGQFPSDGGSPLASGDFALVGAQEGTVKTLVRGHSEGGTAVQGPVTFQGAGVPLFATARPGAVGFSVSGFTLTFTLEQRLA